MYWHRSHVKIWNDNKSSSNSAAPVDGNAAAATGDDYVSGPSSTVAVNQQVFLQQQMELAIKFSLT